MKVRVAHSKSNKETEKWEQKNEYIVNNKIKCLCFNTLIITLNISDINISIRREISSINKKMQPNYCYCKKYTLNTVISIGWK